MEFRKKGAGAWKDSVKNAIAVPSLPIIGHPLRNDLQTAPSDSHLEHLRKPTYDDREWDAKQRSVLAVRWNADGHYCLTCGKDSTIKLWNPRKAQQVGVFAGHGRDVTDVDCSGDSERLISSSMDKQVLLWDVENTTILRRFRGHAGQVNCVKMHEECTLAVSGAVDGTARIWDLRSRSYEPIQVLADPRDTVTAVQITRREIIIGSADGFVYRYDVVAGKVRRDFVGAPVCSLWMGDGCILVQSQDGALRLLDTDNGGLLGQFEGHQISQYRAECQMTAKNVLGTSEDGYIHVWNLLTQQLKQKIEVKSSAATRVMPIASFDRFDDGIIAAAGSRVFLRSAPSL